MGIKLITPIGAITETLQEGAKGTKRTAREILERAGEGAIREARSYNGNAYTDQTGNLRSSTGYAVAEDGHADTLAGFQAVKGTATKGPDEGRAYATELASGANKANTLTLFVTAGMNYARYVEARGYNVLDSARRVTRDYLKKKFTEK